MFFPVTNYFRVSLSNASPTYAIGFDAFVYCESRINDFDNGANVVINYAARNFTPASTQMLCNSADYASPVFKVQAGDSISLNPSGPSNVELFIMQLAPIY